MKHFWKRLPKPFFALAPLEDVSDAAFRRLIAEYSRPGVPRVFYTEFTSADGLVLADPRGQAKLRKKLVFSEHERPIVAQLFSSVPERMAAAARIASSLRFDGIDINMGCPDRAVERSGCGAALIKDPARARELVRAAKTSGLPVSVKTRLGYDRDELDEWLPELLAEEPAAVAIHARTRKEMSLVPARWERIARAVEIRDELGSNALVIGNGDVRDLADARAKAARTGADGVMLGRAVFGNPWLFAGSGESDGSIYRPTPTERIQALARHLELFEELLSGTTHFDVMKKHFKAYVSGWPAHAGMDGAKELRTHLMAASSPEEALRSLANAV